MPQHIKAIETYYAGCRFRSRLEARWAVFFDTLGIRWEYEPEGFETSAGRYLPDFRIELQDFWNRAVDWRWFEVKPDDAPDDPRHAAFVAEGGGRLNIARGMPRDYRDQWMRPYITDLWVDPFAGDGSVRSSVELAKTSSRRFYGAVVGTLGFLRGESFEYADLGPCGWLNSPDQHVATAYAAARSARFEHGESGR